MAKQNLAVSRTPSTLDVLQETGALDEAPVIFQQFDQGDVFMPRIAWNLGKSGLKDPATGRRIPNDEFFDLRNEAALGSEMNGIILYVAKGFDFRKFDGAKTVVHCQSVDRKVGYPRTEVVRPDRDDGGRACESCPHKNPTRRERDDGKAFFTPDCLETYDLLFLHDETGEVYRITLRGRSYRTFKPVVQKFFQVRMQGKLVNIPWYARRVRATLAMAEKADYAICHWEVGELNEPETIRWAAQWVSQRFADAEPANH